MKEQLEQRLESLKAEFEAGQKMLADLEAQEASLRQTLLRISGAIQVLGEELAKANSESNGQLQVAPDRPVQGEPILETADSK
jgi:predicted nuclease with TOPRIM domain